MKILRSTTLSALVLALSACTYSGGVDDAFQYGCPSAAKHTKLVQWNKAQSFDITFQDENFEPTGIYLTAFEPYIIRITNKDNMTRAFFDPSFFHSVALAGISIAGTPYKESCIRAVSIGPGQTAELRLVPLKEGTYYYQESNFLFPSNLSMLIGTGYGIIIVKR